MDELKTLRAILTVYLHERKLLKFIALALLALIVIAAGIEPNWPRVALASIFLIAYLATLHHARALPPPTPPTE